MSKVVLIANRCSKIKLESDCDYVGVDKGAMTCLNQGIKMSCAIGDFDSIDEKQLIQLKKVTKVIQLPKEKDVVDSEYALDYVFKKRYTSIDLYGVIGGRMDHFMVIYELLKSSEIPFRIIDDQNVIYTLEKGVHQFTKKSKYISFFACAPSIITLKGFKYELNNCSVDEFSRFLTSNEIVNNNAKVIVSERFIVMETNE